MLFWCSSSASALAHHAFGGTTPRNAFEGFLSGLAHPIIGLDHFAFVVAAGLLAATQLKGKRGLGLAIAFVLAALGGTGLHLAGLNLPVPEIVIAVSVLAIGAVLALGQEQGLAGRFLIPGAIVAGLFHGYAYGESIVGAEMTPLFAYLTGFTVIQLGVALGTTRLAQALWNLEPDGPVAIPLPVRYVGFVILGVGLAFFSSIVLG